jgi:hypothetical protein
MSQERVFTCDLCASTATHRFAVGQPEGWGSITRFVASTDPKAPPGETHPQVIHDICASCMDEITNRLIVKAALR